MEQSIVVDNTCKLDTQDNDFTTPCRVQKRLFIMSNSSSKRSLFREEKEERENVDNISDAESDLGPMSPLALTDHSSNDSSPGRQFISPLATPERSPIIPLSNWDCSIPDSITSNSNEPISPFSSLKRITRSARYSPRRLFGVSPNSKALHFNQHSQVESILTRTNAVGKTIISNELVLETPEKELDFDDQQSYVAETPQKEEYQEYRLITPLGSMCKNIPIPRIHRRKSLSTLDFNKCISPETKNYNLKRHLEESSFNNVKYQKTGEISLIPKARAALFQGNDNNTSEKEKEFMLNPKSFYGSSDKSNKSITSEWKASSNQEKNVKDTCKKEKEFILNPRSFYGSSGKSYKTISSEWREPQFDLKKRRSLPSYYSSCKKLGRKQRKGEINCGVGHGIKRPKYKRQSLQNNMIKTNKDFNSKNKNIDSKENLNPCIEIENNKKKSLNSKDIDSNKQFFKFKSDHNTIMNEKDTEHIDKRMKLDFDANDLLIDEPAIETSLESTKVDILKILENDWADDDYDTMKTTQTDCTKVNSCSPKKSKLMLKDLTMSPGSELSNMTSTMNIEDYSTSTENFASNNSENVNILTEIPTQKFYPLFSKGYSSDTIDDSNNKKRKRSNSWQLSVKCGNTENQYQIDAGQKIFGATQCDECGVIYHSGDPEDENSHLNYHNSYKILKFQGWKNERIVYNDTYSSSRIILVEPKDSNLYWKKVTEVLKVVDRDLGLSDMKLSLYRDKKVYMYVRNKTILGVLVAEYVKNAFRMIPELMELNCCTAETTPVKCGINVVWTAMSHRRQGIATKLIDTLRSNYYYGYIMSTEDIAFSTPTLSGKYFAEKYTKTRNFKVYN